MDNKENWKLFFGDNEDIIRIDKISYSNILNTFKKGFSDVWAWTAVDFSKDTVGWDKIDEVGKDIFIKTNGYQTLMDSGVVGIYNYLAIAASNPELKIAYQYVAQNESIHAGSYSYGISQMFGYKAEEMIDIANTDPFIKSRMNNENDFEKEFIDSIIRKEEQNFEIVFKVIVATYLLEQIKFPFSFYTTWNINRVYGNAIQGFSQLLKLIAQDELDFHVVLNKHVLKILRKEKRQGFSDVWDEKFIYDYVKTVVKEEKEWSKYLRSNGDIQGFTENITDHLIEYFADKALKNIGLESIYKRETNDTIDWFNAYRKIKDQNAALQESSNVRYNKGVLQNDIASNLSTLKKLYT